MKNASVNDDVAQAIRADVVAQLLTNPVSDIQERALKKWWLRETAAVWSPVSPVPIFLTEMNEGDALGVIKTVLQDFTKTLGFHFAHSASVEDSDAHSLTCDCLMVHDEWFEIDAAPIAERIDKTLSNKSADSINVVVLDVSNVRNPVSLKLLDRAIRFSFNQRGVAAIVTSIARKPPLGEQEGYRGYFKHFSLKTLATASSTGGGTERTPATVGDW